MPYADNVEVVSSAVVPPPAREIPTISIVGYEQYWSRTLKNVAADDDTQIRWREFQEA